MQRRVHRIQKAGNIDHLKLIAEDFDEPSSEEVTIEVHSIGLNFADIFALTGLYSATPKGSFIPGLEFSGLIVKKGKNVSHFLEGDKIMGVTRFGAYANYLNINKNYIYPLPNDWSFSEGSAFIAQALTAYYALYTLGGLKNNSTVLIHSAAGGVGILANRIAKKLNSYTIGTVSDSNKLSLLRSEGYNDFIIRSDDFYEKLKAALNGRELNLVLECIGGKIFDDSYKLLSSGGRIVTYGSANFTPRGTSPDWINVAWNYIFRPKIDPLAMTSENKSVMAFNLIWMWEKIEELSNLLKEVLSLNLKAQLIGREYPFEEAINALYFFKSGKSTGKIILKVR